jgi:hypothetical protein
MWTVKGEVAACDEPNTVPTNNVENAASSASDVSSSATPQVPDGNQKLLEFATSNDVIGLNPAYVEKRLGIPRSKSANSLEFEIGSCQIRYSVEGTAITEFWLSLGPQCTPNIDGERVSNKTTFGDLLRRSDAGEVSATCLYGCGNAADPTILLSYSGYRYNNFTEVTYYTDYSQAGDTLSAWETAVRNNLGLAESDYIEDYTPFIDAKNPPALIRNNILRMKVTDIHVTGG